jgi:peptide/nickel transport system ATP-binding protein
MVYLLKHRMMRKLISIPGTPPNLLNPPSGCRFHPRCPYAKDICGRIEPEMITLEYGRMVACHLYTVIPSNELMDT